MEIRSAKSQIMAILKPAEKYGLRFWQNPSLDYERNGGSEVDLFKENTQTKEVRKDLKVNLKTPLINNLEFPSIISYSQL